MNKRDLLKAAAVGWIPGAVPAALLTAACSTTPPAAAPRSRVRPGDPLWPDRTAWESLGARVGGRLRALAPPFAGLDDAGRAQALAQLANPFWLGDQPELTQTSGWLDAWRSQTSPWVVAARNTQDVVAAVDFARTHRLRLVVKGGGHSYQGTSDAPDSLLVWTRAMNEVRVHDAFVPQGAEDLAAPRSAVSIGAGAMWIDAYDAVTTRAGRYVQGGGCTTVGVAGLVQSGGFGSFSKAFGSAAGGLLEAEIVTADGAVRVVNAQREPDLFWALKGGGGGSFGVVTRLTLRTHELPETFGAVFGKVKAASDSACRALLARTLAFYRDALFNPHWGEQIRCRRDSVQLSMVFQGLTQAQAQAVWQPFVEWVQAHPDCSFVEPLQVRALPARHFWDAAFFRKHAPDLMRADERPGAPAHHSAWAGDIGEAGWYIHGYQSAWLPAALLRDEGRAALADALFAATRHWGVGLHFNKGLAGAPAPALAAARDTATNPQVLDAFALAIVAGGGPPAFAGLPGAARDPVSAHADAHGIGQAMAALRQVAPGAGAYVSESDYFQPDWAQAFWGANHARLAAAKKTWDPEGLFFVHHGVGSEDWSEDGFERRPA